MKHFTPNALAGQPTPTMSANARQIVANPEQYAGKPLLRRLAWATLMGERGKVIDQTQLAQMPVEMGR